MIYTCSRCKHKFESTWTDAEALKEQEINFPRNKEEMEIVCDVCYKTILEWRLAMEKPILTGLV